MPKTLEEEVEALATRLGIYNQGIRFVDMTTAESRERIDWVTDHADDCGCRGCWCAAMVRQMRAAEEYDTDHTCHYCGVDGNGEPCDPCCAQEKPHA
jgi:hypothetical protein